MGELRDRMESDLRLRNYSAHTRRIYLRCARDFARYCGRSPAELGDTEIRAYLTMLVGERHVRPSTQSVYAAALRFLYRITLERPDLAARVPRPWVPETLPEILSVAEVARLLGAVRAPKYRALFMTCYGAGLRITEALALQPADIDSERMLVRIRGGKGARDRYVPLSPRLLAELRAYWRVAPPSGPYLFPGGSPASNAPRCAPSRPARPASPSRANPPGAPCAR